MSAVNFQQPHTYTRANEYLETILNVNNSQATPLASEINVVCGAYKSLEFIHAVLHKMMLKYNISQ